MTSKLLKKLLFRLDGAADSAKTRFTSESGSLWEAEFSLHSGVDAQAPRLMVLFRNLSDPSMPQRYTLAPPDLSKVPREAVREADEGRLREILSRSVKV